MQTTQSNALNTLITFKSQIDPKLEDIFKNEVQRVKDTYNSQHSVSLIKALESFATRGGKRARGALVYHAYQMLGGTDLEAAMQVAIAIEVINAYILITDDVIDLSDSRRGGPTAHKIHEEYFDKTFANNTNNKGDKKHYGISMGILTGFYGAHMAMGILNSADIEPKALKKLNQNLNSKLLDTVHGEIGDITNEIADEISEQDVLNALIGKTAIYTFENPLHMGAILAGATDKELDVLSKFSMKAGLAFQIQDDILGTFGESDSTGKSNKDDLMEGKQTLFINHALQNGGPEQIETINKALGNKEISDILHEKVKQALIDIGSYQYAKDKSLEYVTEAIQYLKTEETKNWNTDSIEFLEGLSMYMIDRDL